MYLLFPNASYHFSPKENGLKLNNSTVRETKKTVEIILITAQKDDEILETA